MRSMGAHSPGSTLTVYDGCTWSPILYPVSLNHLHIKIVRMWLQAATNLRHLRGTKDATRRNTLHGLVSSQTSWTFSSLHKSGLHMYLVFDTISHVAVVYNGGMNSHVTRQKKNVSAEHGCKPAPIYRDNTEPHLSRLTAERAVL